MIFDCKLQLITSLSTMQQEVQAIFALQTSSRTLVDFRTSLFEKRATWTLDAQLGSLINMAEFYISKHNVSREQLEERLLDLEKAIPDSEHKSQDEPFGLLDVYLCIYYAVKCVLNVSSTESAALCGLHALYAVDVDAANYVYLADAIQVEYEEQRLSNTSTKLGLMWKFQTNILSRVNS